VYADEQGRTLDEAQGVDDFPELPVPIPETQPTVEPGDATYSTKKAAIERILLANGRTPAAIVRPCAIYGRGDRMAREWFFVKRTIDRRRYVVLANRGLGHFHTVAAENVGEVVRLLAASPRTDVFNCGDPDPPRVVEIARRIGDAAGHRFTEILLADNAGRGALGQTPWSTPKPLLVDMAKAEEELGYRPVITWADAIPRQVQWLLDATRRRDWQQVLPCGADYLRFEYEEEDALVAELAKA
jgi:nucleoside-diphosphate-sugar epimerase